MLGGKVAVLPAPIFGSLSFNPFTLLDDVLRPAEVGIGRCNVVQPLVMAMVVVRLDERFDLSINAMGLPIAFALIGGEVVRLKDYLLIMNADGPALKVLFADKEYDADFIREDMEGRIGNAMIPTKRNRLIQLPVDPAIYTLRKMVERYFNKLKNTRRLATRYEKTADSYLGFIHIVAIRL